MYSDLTQYPNKKSITHYINLNILRQNEFVESNDVAQPDVTLIFNINKKYTHSMNLYVHIFFHI